MTAHEEAPQSVAVHVEGATMVFVMPVPDTPKIGPCEMLALYTPADESERIKTSPRFPCAVDWEV